VDPGRNDPCWCGSGRKYKRCHLDADRDGMRAIADAMPEIQAQVQRGIDYRRRLQDEFALHVDMVSPTLWDGGRVWAIGSRLYLDRRPNETFHEFILGVLGETLSEEWRAEQEARPVAERHFVYECFAHLWAFQAKNVNPQVLAREGSVSAQVNGWVRYLLSLAWDVASLIHAGEPPPELIERLRDRNQYQGARYELGIAAMFARLNCSIRWLDADPALRDQPHVEFEATHRPSGQMIGVEAKSRHRAGVINQPGEPDDDPLRGDDRAVRALFKKALDKAPTDLSYLIFVDINAPAETDDAWRARTERWLSRMPASSPESPDPYATAYFTNFSPHYDADDPSLHSRWLEFTPAHPSNPPPHELRNDVRGALNASGRVPLFDLDGTLLD
jgi:hypothetical protein